MELDRTDDLNVANDKVAHHNQLCRKTARVHIGRCQSWHLGKRNNRETDCCCASGQALVGGEKGPSRGPMLAPRKGRSQLQTISGSQLIGIEQLPSKIAQGIRWQNLPPRSA